MGPRANTAKAYGQPMHSKDEDGMAEAGPGDIMMQVLYDFGDREDEDEIEE
jgi:hypothetical protein